MTQIRLQLYGERGQLPADALVALIKHTLEMLHELDCTSRGANSRRGRWRISEVWDGSIGLVLEPSTDVHPEVPTRLINGLAVLKDRSELPPWFSESAIGKVQQIGKILKNPGVSGIGLTAVTESGSKTEVQVTQEIVEHAAEAFQGTDEALGSVTGVLDVVNLRRGQRKASLYDTEEQHAVRCTFPEDLLETVRQYLGTKVRAAGTVTRNQVGQITLVKVESLDCIEVVGFVMTVAELTGIAPWYTGERTATEHQQWTRGA
ncbi:MAG: hypothetical protein M1483_01405 [Actinobacteria bacterium]|nr:hypothetical protein [Actinomycetota bacterium]MCL6104290.1 hypothetical protein [Actinomycetota bacterium]